MPPQQRRVSTRFILAYAAGYLGVWLPLLTPVIVTLALKVQSIDPVHNAQNLSLVLGIGAFTALLAQPCFGRLSDRTTSRFGMRRPWLVIGMTGGTIGLLVIAMANSVSQVLVGWCICQLTFNATTAALGALLPDQVPEEQRGVVAGTLSICQPIAVLLGAFIEQVLWSSSYLMFLGPMTIGWALVMMLLLVLRDRRLERAKRRPFTLGELFSTFWVNPLRYSDYGWAWLSQFLLWTGWAMLNTFLALYLLDHLHRRVTDVPRLIFYALLTQTIFLVLSSQLSGWLSDRLARHKIFVFSAAGIYAVALLLVALADSFNMFLIGMAIAGIGLGTYVAVALALVVSVLPSTDTVAKDLGVLNIAGTLPQSIAPAIAPVFLLIAGPKNYTSLFIAASAVVALSALAIKPIRKVR